MDKLRPVEEVVVEIRSRLPSQAEAIAMLQADREYTAGRCAAAYKRWADAIVDSADTMDAVAVILAVAKPPEDLRERLAQMLYGDRWNSHSWDALSEDARNLWRSTAGVAIAELAKKEEDSDG